MMNYQKLAGLLVLDYLERGVDDWIKNAQKLDKSLFDARLTTNQIYSLQNVFFRHNNDYAKQKNEVNKFLKHQVKKEEKKKEKKWAKINKGLSIRLSDFTTIEMEELKESLKRTLNSENLLNNETENAIDDLFNSEIEESREWQENVLFPLLSKKIMLDMLTTYRILDQSKKRNFWAQIYKTMECKK